MKEVWKDVPEWEGHYQVSDQGRVKSLTRVVPHKKLGSQKINEKILKESYSSGYLGVRLTKNNISKTIRTHQLVAMAFLGHKPDGHAIIVDHDNHNKSDNRVCNLILRTSRENLSKDKWRGNYASKYVGVFKTKSGKKWKSQIVVDKKTIRLGHFNTEIEAHNAYQNALIAIEKGEEIVIKRRKTSSKYKGVSFHKGSQKWRSLMYINGKQKLLGYFTSEIDAHNAYQKALKNIKKNGR